MTNTETTVLTAVQNKELTSKEGILQRLFAIWFDAFVYNQIWEDPRVDLEALNISTDSRILTISSGGCNALNYLLANPQSVTAVDLNKNHIYLLDLKVAACRSLSDHDQFFDLFGKGRSRDAHVNYLRYIAPVLNRDARVFWETNTMFNGLLYGDRISFLTGKGLYDHSRNGYFLRFFQRLAKVFGCKPEEVLKAKSLDEQEILYHRHIDPFFDSALIQMIGKLPITMFGLGIPPQQYDELKKDLIDGGSLIDIYRERVKRLACDFPISENYFAWQGFARKYDTEDLKAIPEYLKPENYPTLRQNIDRLDTSVESATDAIKNAPFDTFDRFVFLDAQDWMNAEQMTDLWSAIAEKASPGSRIIFRTAGAASPLDVALPEGLLQRFTYEKELSATLFKKDRASIYGGFHLYVLN